MDFKALTVPALGIILAICLSGCTDFLFANAIVSSTSVHEINQGAIQMVPAPTSNTSKPVITLAREDVFAQHGVNYIIAQNGKVIGLIKPGSYMQWEVDPGVITISYRAKKAKVCYTGKDPCLTRADEFLESDSEYPLKEFSFNALDNEHYYFQLVPDWFLFTDIPRNADIKVIKDIDLSHLKPPHSR